MSDVESDTPEAVPLAQSAKTARLHERDLEAFAVAERKKAKDRNRRRDEQLKQQAAAKKGKVRAGVEPENESRRLEARMARAMEEAEDEEGEEDAGFSGLEAMDEIDDDMESNDEASSSGEDDESGEDAESDAAKDTILEDTEEDSQNEDDSMDDDVLPTSSRSDYLPDDLFASLSRKSTRTTSPPSKSVLQPGRKRKRAVRKGKDIVIGSRVVRTLAPAHRTSGARALSYTPSPGGTTPPARINKFLNRTLCLKGSARKQQGWERKPVNLGVFKHSGGAPLSGFVRSR